MLRDRTWREFISGPDDTVLTELYEPALAQAVRYDRSCAYFASSVLAAAARGFGGLIQNLIALGDAAPRPAVRLMVNEHLDPDDLQALLETGDLTVLEEKLLPRLSDPVDALNKARLEMLAYLVAKGLLEVRVGVMRWGQGIMHAKFGLITDSGGDSLVFAGSGNESRSGLRLNYENLEVSGSWDRPARQAHFAGEFEALWHGSHPAVATLSLPDAVQHELIKLAPEHPPKEPRMSARERQTALMRLQFALEAPFTADGEDAVDATAPVPLWPHQRRVVNDVARAWPDGRLLCDEVGMGKTLEAITSLRRLLAGRGVGRALILVPAGLLRQWQAELREKGGLLVPRLEGNDLLVTPDGQQRRVSFKQAIRDNVLLMSREVARMEHNREVLLAGDGWDVVILDESHAARRKRVAQVGEYNSASLLLTLLRELQLSGKARSLMLLSATPMQTHAWEPWDLLAVLGEGGAWLADFENVERLYNAAEALEARGGTSEETAEFLAHLIAQDSLFPPLAGVVPDPSDEQAVRSALHWPPAGKAQSVATWLRDGSPLGRRMHRNTRETLREYHQRGLLPMRPPTRDVQDVVFDFGTEQERDVYERVKQYIDRRFAELAEAEQRSGKGFVLTVYRRRAASSLRALAESLERRAEALRQVVRSGTADFHDEFDTNDLPDDDELQMDPAALLPHTATQAKRELAELTPLIDGLRQLGTTDSKLQHLRQVIQDVTSDGRGVLVFTQYADTMRHLRTELSRDYGEAVGSYSGEGGSVYRQGRWEAASKDEVTRLLRTGEIKFLVCTDAASEGLNLQAAGAIVNYDLPWNPSRVEQRIGRVDRIGQRLPTVKIVNLHLKNSVDDQVYGALRARCGLFEHFVGEMQPVLALARRMLDGSEEVDVKKLEKEGKNIQKDQVRRAAYRTNSVSDVPPADPSITLRDFSDTLHRLPPQAGVIPLDNGDVQIGNHAFTADLSRLERDPTLRPLSIFDAGLRRLPGELAQPGERLPLVVQTAQCGSFRRTVIRWVDESGESPVLDMADLEARLSGWNGQPADPQRWVEAMKHASEAASAEVEALEKRARIRIETALNRQQQSARFRLTWQLGKFFACRDPFVEKPNHDMHSLMSQGEGARSRMVKAYELMNGYPDWPPALLDELRRFGQKVSHQERKNRLSYKQIDAALDDPRWQTREHR